MSSIKGKPPAKPPMVAHGNGVEVTARIMAAGYRLHNRDKAILIHGTDTKLEDAFESGFIAAHGRPFCENMIYYIAGFNERDVQNFAGHFSMRYEHNMQELFRACYLAPERVFSREEIDIHGINFLVKVLQKIQNGMHLLYESQQKEKQYLITKTTTEKPTDKVESGEKRTFRKPTPISLHKMPPPNPMPVRHSKYEFQVVLSPLTQLDSLTSCLAISCAISFKSKRDYACSRHTSRCI